MKYSLTTSALLFFAGYTAVGGQLVGLTSSNLLSINPHTLSVVTIGSLDLPPGVSPFALTFSRSTGKLYCLAYAFGEGVFTNQYLIQCDSQTGAATILATLGVTEIFETLEYADSRSALIASKGIYGLPSGPQTLVELHEDGSQTTLSTTGALDNDYGVYDRRRDIFYTTDPNGAAHEMVRVNLTTGQAQSVGSIPATAGEVAYSIDDDAVYCADYVTSTFYRITTTDGGGPLTVTPLGSLPGAAVVGLAYIDISSTNDVTLGIEFYAGIKMRGPIGSTNRIEYVMSLGATNWMSLTNIVLQQSPLLFFDADSPRTARRFYRAVRVE